MRKVVREGGDWVFLSCPYLFITYNNPFYLTSLLSVGTGSPVRGPSGLGPGVKLLHGSTCCNFPPYVGCVLLYFIWAHVCQLFVGSAANTPTNNVSVCSHVKDNWLFHTRQLETPTPIYFLNRPGRTGGWNLRKEPSLVFDSMQLGRYWT